MTIQCDRELKGKFTGISLIICDLSWPGLAAERLAPQGLLQTVSGAAKIADNFLLTHPSFLGDL